MKNLILFCFLVSLTSCEPVRNSWSTNIETIKEELPGKHVDLYNQRSELYFFNGLDKIKNNNFLPDFNLALKTQQLLASMGDAHTKIQWEWMLEKKRYLPINLEWFSDGIYVMITSKENKKILGCKLVDIEGIKIKTITDSLQTLLTIDNPSIVKYHVPQLIPLVQVLECFDFITNDTINLGLEDVNDKYIQHKIYPDKLWGRNSIKVKTKKIPLCYTDQRTYFWEKYMPKDKVYYIQYNKCKSREIENQFGDPNRAQRLPSFKEFENRVFETIKNKKVDKLVFDMRFNRGGNSLQGTEFIAKLAKIDNINQKGKLFVIVGRKTFSSAIINTIDFKNDTEAIFVGEKTGGKPNHFGENKHINLPFKGLKVQYSTKYFRLTDDKSNTFTPDKEIESSFEDYVKGRDPVYEWIKKQ